MSVTVTKLYHSLSTKLGNETAENLTTFIDNKIHDVMESKVDHLATKEELVREIAKLDVKIVETREALTKEIGETKTDLLKQIARLDTKIDEKFGALVKWSFLFWVAQAAVILIKK